MPALATSVAVGMHSADGEITDLQAAANTLLARSVGIVSVSDYGAAGDGKADDTAAIASALAALPSTGGTLLFPGKTYKCNISTARGGIHFWGTGSGNVNTGNAGTKLITAVAGSPVIQIGDGATTSCRGVRISNVLIQGDTGNAGSHGIYLYGARDVVVDNVALTAFGGDCIKIDNNTTSSSGIHLIGCAIAGASGACVRVLTSGASFTTDITLTACHIDANASAGCYGLYLDSTTLWLSNTYLDLNDGAIGGHVYMAATSANPQIVCSNVAFDNAGGAAAISLDVSAWITKANRLATAITGTFTFNGKVKYSDATIAQSTSCASVTYQPRHLNPSILNKLYFPLDEADITGNTVGLSRTGTSGGGGEAVSLNGAAMFSLNRAQFTQVAVTYSASMTPDMALASFFTITPTDGTAYTVNSPSHQAQGQPFWIQTINSRGGGLGLGAATWNAIFHLGSAWAQPADGFNVISCFVRWGTNIYEISRMPGLAN